MSVAFTRRVGIPILAQALTGSHSIFDAAAPQSARIEHLFWFMFVVCIAIYIITVSFFAVGGALTYTPVRRPLAIIKNTAADKIASWWVGSAIAVTLVILFSFLAMSMKTGADVMGASVHNAVTVQVTGHQWWWELTYLDSQPDRTIVTANEIHVPVGERVAIVTNSSDVIHSFWSPSITGKRDLIPGYSTAFTFRVDRPGTYRGMCAEFCGLQHAHMGFLVIAQSFDDFDAWQQAQRKSASEPADDKNARGKEIFLTHSCIMCHTIRGTTAGSRVGPDLTHVASRSTIGADLLANNTGSLSGWILDPQRMKPGTLMPPTALGGGELDALVSYLQSLK
jgi:cytochrome c oxidase subunit 2